MLQHPPPIGLALLAGVSPTAMHGKLSKSLLRTCMGTCMGKYGELLQLENHTHGQDFRTHCKKCTLTCSSSFSCSADSNLSCSCSMQCFRDLQQQQNVQISKVAERRCRQIGIVCTPGHIRICQYASCCNRTSSLWTTLKGLRT